MTTKFYWVGCLLPLLFKPIRYFNKYDESTCSLIMDHIPRHLKPKIMQRQIKKRVPTNKWRWNESWILCLALCWPICLGLNILMTTFISDAGGFCWNLVFKLMKFQAIIKEKLPFFRQKMWSLKCIFFSSSTLMYTDMTGTMFQNN